MTLELDKRIPNQNCIFTCFDTECAEQYVGKQGYFTNCYTLFTNINSLDKGKLLKICDGSINEKYYTSVGEKYYSFFLPEDMLIPKKKEKKYRPYTLIEFIDKFTIGRPVSFRRKDTKCSKYLVLLGYWDEPCESKIVTYISFGSHYFSLDVLFEEYEWQDRDSGDWKPFGVEE